MSRIIDDMIDFYCDAHGKLRLRLAPVELAAVVFHAIENARPSLTAGNHRFSVSLPPETVSLLADASRLEQILTNLLTNAAKYTESGGFIYLTADLWTDVVVIRVRDNGIGIAPDLLPRIFDPFQQGNDSAGCFSGGLGLGLTLVKSLVELHGGRVAAYSGGLDMGSEFVVSLPVASVEDQPLVAP
jgi:signal transduction histidine kinase